MRSKFRRTIIGEIMETYKKQATFVISLNNLSPEHRSTAVSVESSTFGGGVSGRGTLIDARDY